MPPGNGIRRGGVGMTGPVAVEQLPTERARMSPLDVPAGRLALRQAERRLAVSEQELEKTKELLKTAAVSMAEVDARVFTVELNKMALERAIQEYEAHTKLLELDLREAEVELQAAEQEVKQAPARPQAEIEVQKARLRLERARTLLDLHTRETSLGADSATVAEQAEERRLPMNNLKQIGLAMHNYHDAHRAFPPAYRAENSGRPLLSWRVLILPYLEQDACTVNSTSTSPGTAKTTRN